MVNLGKNLPHLSGLFDGSRTIPPAWPALTSATLGAMLELKFRCEICGAETVNPTRVHVCPGCGRRVCSDCLPGHREADGVVHPRTHPDDP